MPALVALGLGLAMAACNPSDPGREDLPGGWLSAERPLTAFVFLSTECPLSQNYTRQLNELSATEEDVEVVGVFPLADDDEERVAAFRDRYEVRFATRPDHEYELVTALRPTITPEVFLLDADGQVMYSGKIDDWAVELGRTRKAAKEHYLADAIHAHIAGVEVPLRRVEPVGCFLPEEPYVVRGE